MKSKTKKRSRKMKAKSQTKIITLAINGNSIVKTGGIVSGTNGDIRVEEGDTIRFVYPTDTQTFALFIIRFTPNPGQGGGPNQSPFNARVYITDDGHLEKKVKVGAKKGRYDYRLALLADNGDLVTEDPQIIVQ